MQIFPLRFFSDTPKFDFMGKRWLGFALSGLMVVASSYHARSKRA